jgi:hypothetical protein
MAETIKNLTLFPIFLITEAAGENSGGFLTKCMPTLTFLSLEADFHRIGLGKFYHRERSYPHQQNKSDSGGTILICSSERFEDRIIA